MGQFVRNLVPFDRYPHRCAPVLMNSTPHAYMNRLAVNTIGLLQEYPGLWGEWVRGSGERGRGRGGLIVVQLCLLYICLAAPDKIRGMAVWYCRMQPLQSILEANVRII
jgi:hypothetical protein